MGGNWMFVRSAMKQKNKTNYVTKDTLVGDALKLLEKFEIDGMPIVDGNYYIGMVTINSIYEAFFQGDLPKEEFLNSTKVFDIAKYEDIYVDEDEVFENTLLMVKNRPLVAVVNDEKELLGIVTRFDVLEQFQSAFGMRTRGIRISFAASEAEGRIAKLAEIAKQYHENIISLATFDDADKFVRRIVMKVEKKENIEKFVQKLEKSGFRILHIKED
jgi:CBS domain-containing protein